MKRKRSGGVFLIRVLQLDWRSEHPIILPRLYLSTNLTTLGPRNIRNTRKEANGFELSGIFFLLYQTEYTDLIIPNQISTCLTELQHI